MTYLPRRAAGKTKKAKLPKAALNELEERSRSVSRNLLVALTARVAFFLLPFLPLRIKNLSVISKVADCSQLSPSACACLGLNPLAI